MPWWQWWDGVARTARPGIRSSYAIRVVERKMDGSERGMKEKPKEMKAKQHETKRTCKGNAGVVTARVAVVGWIGKDSKAGK